MGTPITLNGLTVIEAKIRIPWRGVWHADLTLDVLDTSVVGALIAAPAAPLVLVIGGSVLSCVIDPEASGTFVSRAMVRVVGGRNGWAKTVPAQHFYDPTGGLLSPLVIAATALLVGEVAADPLPQFLGEHYVRLEGPASAIFGDRDWHVDLTTGAATTLPWVPSVTDPASTQILDYVIPEGRVTVSSESLILPGTVLIDPRFNGAAPVVRDVELVFASDSVTGDLWFSTGAVSRLAEALTSLVREAARTRYLATYRYRFILPAGSKLQLQAVDSGAPDLNPIEQWTGLSGSSAKLTPGTEIIVGFADGNGAHPYLVSYSPLAVPTEIDFGPLPQPIAYAAPVVSAFAAVATYVAALTAALAANPTTYTPFAAAMAAPGAALATALSLVAGATPTILTRAT